MDPGVGARLIYSTILPRDEHQHFSSNFPRMMDEPERQLVNVSKFIQNLPGCSLRISNPCSFLVQAVQGIVASNAHGRAHCKWIKG